LTAASNTLVSSLYLARNEAIKRNGRVVLCKTIDGIHCAATGGWEQGWIIFHDTNNNSLREDVEPIIQHQQALSASLRMTGNATVESYISFVSTGGTRLVGGGFQAGTLTLCRASTSAADARQVILNAAGRPRTQKAAIPACE
ncbi:MAG: GspH/FimT family protein, partial [Ramlibacter sp.]